MKITVDLKVTDKEFKEVLESIVILVDKREKDNEHIISYFEVNNIKYEMKSLEVGDYSFYLPKGNFYNQDLYFQDSIVVERKNSLEELSGNFSERTRLENELSLAYDLKAKVYLLIEKGTLEDIEKGNYKTDYNKNAYFGSFMTFMDRYNLTPLFIQKELSGKIIYNTFKYYLRNRIK